MSSDEEESEDTKNLKRKRNARNSADTPPGSKNHRLHNISYDNPRMEDETKDLTARETESSSKNL